MPPWVDLSVLEDFGLGPQDRAAWLASGLPEDAFEDSLMDRVARRPSGEPARATYGAAKEESQVITRSGSQALYAQ